MHNVRGEKIFNIPFIEFFTNLANPEPNTLDFVSPTEETGKLLIRKDNLSVFSRFPFPIPRSREVSQTHCTYESHLSFSLDLPETTASRNEHVLRVPREPCTSRPPTAVALSLGGESLGAAHGGVPPVFSRGYVSRCDGRGW